MAGKALRQSAAALGVLVSVAAAWTTPVAAGDSFPAAVERILLNQKTGPISALDAHKKRAMITCVNKVLTDMPNGMKRFVLAANDYNELERRFGKVVMENRAEWKQKIARGCAHIVV